MENVTLEELDDNNTESDDRVRLIRDEKALLSTVDVELTIVFGSAKLPLDRLLGLSAGDVVKLEQSVEQPVSLEYDGKEIAKGVLVAEDGKLGVRVLGRQDN